MKKLNIRIDDPCICYSGRWKNKNGEMHGTFQGYVKIKFSGTHIEITGRGCVYTALDDGQPVKKVLDTDDIVIFAENGMHELYLYSAWQCAFPVIKSIKLDGELLPVKPQGSIEFIGDSIMEGYCDPTDRDATYGNNGSMISYAYSVGRRFEREHNIMFNLIAYGGIGVGRRREETHFDWAIMAERYALEREYIPDEGEQVKVNEWDHSLFTPEHICINLGTNDWNLPDDEFVQKYHELLEMLRAYYPKLKKIFIMTPFCEWKRDAILRMVEEEQHAGKNVVLIDSAQWEIPNGSRDVHPSPESHKRAAELLYNALAAEIL